MKRLLFIVVTLMALGTAAYAAPTPPKQPQKGPGGFDYKYGSVTMNRYGTGADSYWIYTPQDPVPVSAPVIVFLHGWGGMDPVSYGGWIDHLVRKGNIVIFPRYQVDLFTPPVEMTDNALKAISDALATLDNGPVKPQRENFAIIGHSLGGVIAANLASDAADGKLPQPKALMLVAPGDSKNSNIAQAFGIAEDVPSIVEDYSAIPASTLMLCVIGRDDLLVGSTAARNIYYRARNIAPENKDFVAVVSDRHGSPQLIANHFAPLAPDERYREEKNSRLRDRLRDRLGKQLAIATSMEGATTDALDYYGFWKLGDALLASAFTGEYREYALGSSYDMKFMGKWSDGVPVLPLEVTQTP
jgi:pimeloyl-ACP methyl ester carboxylesterase